MSHDPDLLLDLLVSGDGPARAEMESHVASCPECSARLVTDREIFAAVALEAPAERPARNLLDRLVGSLSHLERFASYAPGVGALLDLSPNDARYVLHAFSDEAGWVAAPFPGIRWRRSPRGPRLATGQTLLAEVSPGAVIPMHRHIGGEAMMVIEGSLLDGSGRLVQAGETLEQPDGSAHDVRVPASDTVPCRCIVVNERSVEFE
jgi:hypothetical protein